MPNFAEFFLDSYFGEGIDQPKVNDYNLDWCLSWATDCGEPAATAFCQYKHFQQATDYEKTSNGRNVTKTIGSHELCRKRVNQANCDGFNYIQCSDRE